MPTKKDFIFLEGLQTQCVIGIFEWERKIKQKVVIDLKFPVATRRAARRDRIEDAVNYKRIAKFLLRKVPQTKFRLVESLTEEIARSLLKEFKLKEVTVRLSKPGAVRGTRNVGVQITRKS